MWVWDSGTTSTDPRHSSRGRVKHIFDAKVNDVTTPQNPSAGNDLQHLRSRYGTPSAAVPRPNVPVPPAQTPAPPSAPSAAHNNVQHHLPHDDQVDPFADLDDDVVFESGGPTTPDEWQDDSHVSRHTADAPLFDQHTSADTFGSQHRAGDYDDSFAGTDDYRVNAKSDRPKQGVRAFLSNTLHLPIGKGKSELEYDHLITISNRSLLSPKVIGVLGGKGGVGKTSSAISLASMLASIRSKPVVAVTLDYNSTLSLRTKEVSAPARGDVSLKDFATDQTIRTPNDIAGCMRNNKHRLSVMGVGLNPMASPLTPKEFLHALRLLRSQYELVIIDFGNSPNTDTFWTALKSLDYMVLVTSTENDSMQGTRLIENLAREAGLIDLLSRRTLEIVNSRSPADPKVDLDHFVGRIQSVDQREVIQIPWDDHLSESGPVDLDLMSKSTRWQFLLASAIVIKNLPA